MRTVEHAAAEVEGRTKPKTAKPKTAAKPEKFPVRLLAIDVIKVDHDLQSRVNMSLEDQREFSEAMLRGDTFPPVTVFFDGKVYWLADGFHRVGAAKQAAKVKPHLKDIRAEIRDGSKRDAIIFSAGANQKFSIRRTDEDKRKAVEMLVSDPECLQWSPPRIGDHCGVSPTFARRLRDEYLARNHIALPSHVISAKGEKTRTKQSRTTGNPVIPAKRYNNTIGFQATVNHKRIYGNTEAKVMAKVENIKADATAKRLLLHSISLCNYLNRHYLFAECCFLRFGGGVRSGVKTADAIIVGTTEIGTDAILKAIGILCLLPHRTGQVDPRRIVACYPEDYPAALLDLARKDGIEFLTPDELVESLKPTSSTEK